MEKQKPSLTNNSALTRRVFFWNAAGSFTNALSSVFLLAIVTRVLGPVQGGIFTIAFALAQQLLTVSNFETGTYYVTDAKNKIGFDVHIAAKLLLFFISLAAAVVIALTKYAPYKAAVVVLLCIFKGADAFSGLFSAFLQRQGRLDIAGKSLTMRMLFSLILFSVVIIISKDLIVSAAACIIFSVFWLVFYDIRYVRTFTKLKARWDIKLIISLIAGCLPMFLGTFLLTYIINQPKYVIDALLDEVTQNKFGIIFMPSAVICLLGMFIYRPLLTSLTDVWNDKQHFGFLFEILKIAGIIFGLTVLCTVAARFLGIPVLSFIYGENLDGLEAQLCMIILGGGMYGLSMLLYNAIVIMRHQYVMLVAYIITYILSLAITSPLVQNYDISGASASYLISTTILAFLMAGMFLFYVFFERRKSVKEENR